MIKNIGRTKITLISGFIAVVIAGTLLYIYRRQSVSSEENSTEIGNPEEPSKEDEPASDISSAPGTIKRSLRVHSNLSDKDKEDSSPSPLDEGEVQSLSSPLKQIEDPQASSFPPADNERIRAFPAQEPSKEPLIVAKAATLSSAINYPSTSNLDGKSAIKDGAKDRKVSFTISGEADPADEQSSGENYFGKNMSFDTVLYYNKVYDNSETKELFEEKDRKAANISSHVLNASAKPIVPIPSLPPLESPGLVKAAALQLKKQLNLRPVTASSTENAIKNSDKVSNAKNKSEPGVIIKPVPENSAAKAASDSIIDTASKKEPSTAPADEKDHLSSTPGIKKSSPVPAAGVDGSLVSAGIKGDASTASAPLEDTLPDGTFKNGLSNNTPRGNASLYSITQKASMNASNTSIHILDTISEVSNDMELPLMPTPVKVVDYSSGNKKAAKEEKDSTSPVSLESLPEIPLV